MVWTPDSAIRRDTRLIFSSNTSWSRRTRMAIIAAKEKQEQNCNLQSTKRQCQYSHFALEKFVKSKESSVFTNFFKLIFWIFHFWKNSWNHNLRFTWQIAQSVFTNFFELKVHLDWQVAFSRDLMPRSLSLYSYIFFSHIRKWWNTDENKNVEALALQEQD